MNRLTCNNAYCDSKPNWFGNYVLCSQCQHLAAEMFVHSQLLSKTLENLKEVSE